MALPISKSQTLKAAKWMKTNFGQAMSAAAAGTPFSVDHICAIACQETAFMWVKWIDTMTVDEVLKNCIGDASGDAPGTSRNPFPKNTAAFRARFGDELTDMLIAETNRSREIRGFAPRQWVYKGWGIYQYDLQHILDGEPAFFTDKKWYVYSECLAILMKELKGKFAATGNVRKAIKAYNGSGPKAEQYVKNVLEFTQFCSEVTGE